MKEGQLKRQVESCTNQLQGNVDLQSAQAITTFQMKSEDNFRRLDDLKDKFQTNYQAIEDYKLVKTQFRTKIEDFEKSLEYHEKLADEIEEFLAESNVKKKVAIKRQSRQTT
ncbi:LADA_0G12860g1_1 [Lachancea dasiensis]|uniref:Biogenesis of lysosome-related organelles complex 1 subunit BLI1 n=1 Tax=Lachancea dasiensis TaxID=1072105 RepID=A0A1G4JVM3_9SACH|nr:LADA_0G12860g1_1 [Lachancea dasiensis]